MRSSRFLCKSLVTVSCLAMLSGCGWLQDWPPSGSSKEAFRAPPPEPRVMRTSQSTYIEPEKTLEAVPVKAQDDPSYQNAMKRIDKLESNVEALRNDLSMMMPALTKLAEAQGDIQSLLQQMNGGRAVQPTVEPSAGAYENANANSAPRSLTPRRSSETQQLSESQQQMEAAQPQTRSPQYDQALARNAQEALQQMGQAAPQRAQQQPRQIAANSAAAHNTARPQYNNNTASAGPAVQQMRFGEHPDKTRIVFDTGQQLSFDYDLDNGENILLVKFPRASWNAARQATIGNSALVQSYSAMSNAQGGTDVIVQLKKRARVEWAQAIPPAGAGQGHRIVLDVAPL